MASVSVYNKEGKEVEKIDSASLAYNSRSDPFTGTGNPHGPENHDLFAASDSGKRRAVRIITILHIHSYHRTYSDLKKRIYIKR